jgi:hypothetical protein
MPDIPKPVYIYAWMFLGESKQLNAEQLNATA